MTKIFIVDDHPMVVVGLKFLLGQMKDTIVIGSAASATETIPFLKEHIVDIMLLDINLPDISGMDLCKKVKKEFPAVKILAISTYSERSYISRMIENGASGYLVKSASSEEIVNAVQSVLKGKLYLSSIIEEIMWPSSLTSLDGLLTITKREREVLQLISEGFTNNQIAEKLFISHLTVDSHRKNLLTKLKVNNTAALIRLAVEHHLL